MQRDAVPLELDGEHAVPGTGGDRRAPAVGGDLHLFGKAGEVDEQAGPVGDVVERVPGAERADPGARGHEVPRLVHRRHADDALREVSVGACPVQLALDVDHGFILHRPACDRHVDAADQAAWCAAAH